MSRTTAIRILKRLLRSERGNAALVEFTFIAAILFSLLFGMLCLSLATYSAHWVSYAAQQGARYAIVHGADSGTGSACSTTVANAATKFNCEASATDVQNYIESLESGGITNSNVTVNTSTMYPGGTTPAGTTCASGSEAQGCPVNVTVSYTFNLLPLPHPAGNFMMGSWTTSWVFSSTAEEAIQ